MLSEKPDMPHQFNIDFNPVLNITVSRPNKTSCLKEVVELQRKA